MTTPLFDVVPPPEEPHILVVEDGDGGYPAYRIDCPGVTARCRAWEPCGRDCDWAVLDVDLDQLRQAHGEEHRYLGDADDWCVPTSRCWLVHYEDLSDVAEDIATTNGRYPVTFAIDDGPSLQLQLATEATR